MGNLLFGNAERQGNPIDAGEIPIVRDNDVAIGQGARPTERPDENSAQAASAARHIYTVSQKTIHYNFAQLCQMLTDFESSFIDRFTSKFSTKSSLTIPPYLKCVATLPCELSVFKNCHVQDLSEASCHARLSHSKQFLKKFLSHFSDV